jgi:hypothetical protein
LIFVCSALIFRFGIDHSSIHSHVFILRQKHNKNKKRNAPVFPLNFVDFSTQAAFHLQWLNGAYQAVRG